MKICEKSTLRIAGTEIVDMFACVLMLFTVMMLVINQARFKLRVFIRKSKYHHHYFVFQNLYKNNEFAFPL